jgi:arsenate reductase-like glutaredoxin family protein
MTRKILNLPIKSSKNQKSAVINEVIAQKSSLIINLVGYTILGLIFLDYIELFIPPKFFNPVWEFETIGKMVETAWAPLLGFVLIFYRRNNEIIKIGQLKILLLFSRLALVLGVIYLITVPLLISDSLRIQQSDRTQFNRQIELQNQQAEQIKDRLNQINETQFSKLLQAQGQQIPDLNSSSPEELKEKLFNQLQQNQDLVNSKVTTAMKQRQQTLWKSTCKWAIGGILAGVSLIFVARYTNWSKKLIRSYEDEF